MAIKKGTIQLPNGDDFYPVTDVTLVAGMPTKLSDLQPSENGMLVTEAEKDYWDDKQDFLVSGNNIKTINNNSILGSGNISISTSDILGYQIRTNNTNKLLAASMYRYRLMFTGIDGTKWVPANSNSSTSSTAVKTVTTIPIDPFGAIGYYNATTMVATNSSPSNTSVFLQIANISIGYSFNPTGTISLLQYRPIYVVCAPRSDTGAVIDSTTPFTQTLPTTEDGKIYIYLGIAQSTTAFELALNHPVYYYKSGALRLWTNAPTSGSGVTDVVAAGGTSIVSGGVATLPSFCEGDGVTKIKSLTESAYAALPQKEPTTLYIVLPDSQ